MAADPNYDWLSELPVPIGDPFLRMGTRGIDPSQWLTVDHRIDEEFALRRELIGVHPTHAELLDGHEAELIELSRLVEKHIGRPLSNGPAVPTVRCELSDLAVSIQEDVLLMVRNDEHWYLAGGVLLFPDQWALSEKIGRSIAEIHAPTNGYDELLRAKVDQFFDRLAAGRVIGRRNWFIHDTPTHFLSTTIQHPPVADPADVAKLWIRSERQTLRRLPESDAIVFTVKTQFAPFAEVRSRPEVASSLVSFLEAASDESLRNKDAVGRREAVISYLTQ